MAARRDTTLSLMERGGDNENFESWSDEASAGVQEQTRLESDAGIQDDVISVLKKEMSLSAADDQEGASELEAKLREVMNFASTLKEARASHEVDIESLRTASAVQREELEALRACNEDALSKHAAESEEKVLLKGEVDGLESQVRSLLEQVREEADRANAAESSNEELLHNNMVAESSQESCQSALSKAAQESEQKVQDLQKQLLGLQEQLQEATNRASTAEEIRDELLERVAKEELTVETMQELNAELKRSAEIAQGLAEFRKEEIGTIQAEHDALLSQNGQLSEQMRDSEGEVLRLKEQIECLSVNLVQAEANRGDTANADNEDKHVLQAAHDELHTLHTEAVQKMAGLQQEVEELRSAAKVNAAERQSTEQVGAAHIPTPVEHPLAKDSPSKGLAEGQEELEQLRRAQADKDALLASQTASLEQERKRSDQLQSALDNLRATQTPSEVPKLDLSADIELGQSASAFGFPLGSFAIAGGKTLADLGCGDLESLKTVDLAVRNLSALMTLRSDVRLSVFGIWILCHAVYMVHVFYMHFHR